MRRLALAVAVHVGLVLALAALPRPPLVVPALPLRRFHWRLEARQELQNLRHFTFCVLIQPPGPCLQPPS